MSNVILNMILISINIHFLLCKPFHITNNDIIYKFMRDKSGNYEYMFQSQASRPEDDIQAEEKGTLTKTSEGKEVLKVTGSFGYNPTCDHVVIVRYTADENGYMPHVEQYFNRQLIKEDGKIVGFVAVCSTVNRLPVGAACIASLQGGCIGK